MIVDAELARTAITDRALGEIAAWPRLRRLDLTQTAVTAAGVAKLNQAQVLQALNLTATPVTETDVAPLRARAGLTVYAAPDLGLK